MPLEAPYKASTYLNKGVLLGIGGSWLVAVLWFGPLAKVHLRESGMNGSGDEADSAAARAMGDRTALFQQVMTWTVQSMAMYYLVKQMDIGDPIKASLAVGGVVGVFYAALPHYMRWRWLKEKSNKTIIAIGIDCGGHILFSMAQAYCVTQFGP